MAILFFDTTNNKNKNKNSASWSADDSISSQASSQVNAFSRLSEYIWKWHRKRWKPLINLSFIVIIFNPIYFKWKNKQKKTCTDECGFKVEWEIGGPATIIRTREPWYASISDVLDLPRLMGGGVRCHRPSRRCDGGGSSWQRRTVISEVWQSRTRRSFFPRLFKSKFIIRTIFRTKDALSKWRRTDCCLMTIKTWSLEPRFANFYTIST